MQKVVQTMDLICDMSTRSVVHGGHGLSGRQTRQGVRRDSEVLGEFWNDKKTMESLMLKMSTECQALRQKHQPALL